MHRLSIAILLGLTACGGTESRDGAEVFASICANCHGPDGKPPATQIAKLNVRDLTSAEFRKRSTLELVEHQVRWGSENKLMPAFEGVLREDQIKAVAQYVATRFH